MTYRAISKESLKELLGLQEKDLEPLIKSKNWNQTSDSVVLQKEEAKFTKNRENVKLQGFFSLFNHVKTYIIFFFKIYLECWLIFINFLIKKFIRIIIFFWY